MSTRSVIGVYDEVTDSVKFVYCHSDGYPEHMVPALRRYIDKEVIMNEIISIGGFRFLDKGLGPERPYGKDDGDEPVPTDSKTLYDFIHERNLYGADFRYLFYKGEWICFGFNPFDFDEEDWEEYRPEFEELLDLNSDVLGGYRFI